jgi:hypothetical protein
MSQNITSFLSLQFVCVVTLRKILKRLSNLTHQHYAKYSLRELFDIVNEIKALIDKEIRLELRQKYAINGMLLYIVSTVYVCYLSFRLKTNHIDKITWNTLFGLSFFSQQLMLLPKLHAGALRASSLLLYLS